MAKRYGIYQVDVCIDKREPSKTLWGFEVSFIDFGGTTNILHREYIPECDSFKWAESVGLDWLYNHLEQQLKEVKEALDNV